MNEPTLSFFERLLVAWLLPWRVLFNGSLAARVKQAVDGTALPPPPEAPPPPPAALLPPAPPPRPIADGALQLLGLLQREGRLVDFLQEELTGATDEQIGAGARVVHEGCRKALHKYVTLSPVREEEEGTPVTLPPGFDAAAIKVTGNVVGQPPWTGALAHRGWRASPKLPELQPGHDVTIVAQAEVEL